MDLVDLKIRTIYGAYRTLPLEFQDWMHWKSIEKDLKDGHFGEFADAVRMKELSLTVTDTINMEYVASVAECTSKLDLIQLTSIHILSTFV